MGFGREGLDGSVVMCSRSSALGVTGAELDSTGVLIDWTWERSCDVFKLGRKIDCPWIDR